MFQTFDRGFDSDCMFDRLWRLVVSLNKTLTPNSTGPEVIKLFFMLNSAETKIDTAHKC